MSSALGTTYSIQVLLVAFGTLAALLGFLALMLERLRRRGALEAGLIHIVFLPERRRAFLRLITLLAIFFILSGLNATLVSVGAVNTLTENVVNSVAYAGGAISLLLLIWVGLRPVNLPADRRLELERSSQEMILLAFAPSEARNSDLKPS
jgi:hypothetical protein